MPGKLALDTSAVIDFLREEAAAVRVIADAGVICLPATTLGELYFGWERSQRLAASLAKIETFARDAVLLACDEYTARQYARTTAALFARGRPIPEGDIWIAASALQHGLPLATRDGHFREIDGLSLVTW